MVQAPDVLVRAEQAARAAVYAKLKLSGIDLSEVPFHEQQAGTGPVISALMQWASRIKELQVQNRIEEKLALEELLKRVFAWRQQAAQLMDTSPSNILPSHLAKKVCCNVLTTTAALNAAGVRTKSAPQLAALLRSSAIELGLLEDKQEQHEQHEQQTLTLHQAEPRAALTNAKPHTEPQTAHLSSYKISLPTVVVPQLDNSASDASTNTTKTKTSKAKAKAKPLKDPNWLVSAKRFRAGEAIDKIACSQANSRTIQAATVRQHVLRAVVEGSQHETLVLDLQRLHDESQRCSAGTISKYQWDAFEASWKDPSETAKLDEVLQHVRPELAEIIQLPRLSRTDEQRACYTRWIHAADWFQVLKRSKVQVLWVK